MIVSKLLRFFLILLLIIGLSGWSWSSLVDWDDDISQNTNNSIEEKNVQTKKNNWDDDIGQNINKAIKEMNVQIKKTKQQIKSLKKYQSKQLFPLRKNYFSEYQEYYRYLVRELPETGINSHENLLRHCNQYLELCNQLNRTAMLQVYIGWIDNKSVAVKTQTEQLDQSRWILEKKVEMRQILSPEEIHDLEEIIDSTQQTLKEQIPVPERTEIARTEEGIFNEILNLSEKG